MTGLEEVASQPSHTLVAHFIAMDSLETFQKRYNEFRDEVGHGKLGKTAQLWLTYSDSVWDQLRFHIAVKENNLDIYMASMYCLCSLLFSADHLHYARYLPLYYQQLMELPASHPGAPELLRANGFSVARSSIPSSRNAVDLTIEQTINLAAKTAGGVVGINLKPSTYQRWSITRHTRFPQTKVTGKRPI